MNSIVFILSPIFLLVFQTYLIYCQVQLVSAFVYLLDVRTFKGPLKVLQMKCFPTLFRCQMGLDVEQVLQIKVLGIYFVTSFCIQRSKGDCCSVERILYGLSVLLQTKNNEEFATASVVACARISITKFTVTTIFICFLTYVNKQNFRIQGTINSSTIQHP